MDYIPKILKINYIENYKISCLFNNGENRSIDFNFFFTHQKKISSKHSAYKLLQDIDEFKQVEIINNTLTWQNTGIYAKNFDGQETFFHFDLDPIVIFQNSVLEESNALLMGFLLKELRQKEGLSQEEIAKKTALSPEIIMDLENNMTDITILKKIIEQGLGKKLRFEIQ